MKKAAKQHIVVEKTLYKSDSPDYEPVLFSIEVEDEFIRGIKETSAKRLWELLGDFFNKEGVA
jgi:hypothetical protein